MGGLQIEWHANGLDIEIAISEPLSANVWVEDINASSDGIETNLTNDFTNLLPWIDRLG